MPVPPYPGQPPYMGHDLVPVPGQSQYPPAFNYGVNPGTYTSLPAGTISSTAVGMMGAAPTAVMGAGALASVGSMFAPSSALLRGASFLDPTNVGFGMAGRAFSAAGGMANLPRALMMGAGAGAIPIAAGLAGAAAVDYAGRRMIGGARDHNQLSAQLSHLQFANMSSGELQGFSHDQINTIGSAMRQFEANDPFIGMQDTLRMMDRFTSMGMDQGVQNAKEFADKFTVFLGSVREIAEQLGQTMDDAVQFFQESRRTGFYTAADVMSNLRNAQLSRGLGISQQAFTAGQTQAAGSARGMGLRGQAGAGVAARISQDLMMGTMSNMIGRDSLLDVTGAEDLGTATTMLGARMAGSVGNFLTRTGAGRGLLAAVGQQEGGRFTGGIDQDTLAEMLHDGSGLGDISARASRRMTTSGQRLSFVTNQAGLASALMESDEGAALVFSQIENAAREWAGDSGAEDQDAIRRFLQMQLQMSEKEAAIFAETLQNRERLRSERRMRMRQEMTAAQRRLEMRRNRTLGGLTQGAMGTIEDAFSPAAQLGADLTSGIEMRLQDSSDALFGVSRGQLTTDAHIGFQRDLLMGQATALDMDADMSAQEESMELVRSFHRGGYTTVAGQLEAHHGYRGGRAMLRAIHAGNASDVAMRTRIGRHALASGLDSGELAGDLHELVNRYRMAEESGDENAKRTLVDAMADKMPGTYVGRGQKRIAAAAVLAQRGEDDLAALLMQDGDLAAKGYETLSEARAKTAQMAKAMGLSEEHARALSQGGQGAIAIAAMKRQGVSAEDFRAAMRSGDMSEMQAKLGVDFSELTHAQKILDSGISGQDLTERLALRASTLGMSNIFSSRHRGDNLAGWGMLVADLYTMGGASGLADILSYSSQDADALIDQIAASTDMALAEEHTSAVKANVAQLPESIKASLPRDVRRRLERGETTAEDMRLITSMASSGAFDQVVGGGALAGVGRRVRRGGASARDLIGAFGQEAVDDIISRTDDISSLDEASPDQIQALAHRLGMSNLTGELASGAGGGIAYRGMTESQKVAQMLDTAAEKMTKMAEVIDTLYDKARPSLNSASETSKE